MLLNGELLSSQNVCLKTSIISTFSFRCPRPLLKVSILKIFPQNSYGNSLKYSKRFRIPKLKLLTKHIAASNRNQTVSNQTTFFILTNPLHRTTLLISITRLCQLLSLIDKSSLISLDHKKYFLILDSARCFSAGQFKLSDE